MLLSHVLAIEDSTNTKISYIIHFTSIRTNLPQNLLRNYISSMKDLESSKNEPLKSNLNHHLISSWKFMHAFI